MNINEIERVYNPKLFTPEMLAEVERFATLIHKNCKQIVHIYDTNDGEYFYRGLANTKEPFLVGQSKENRAPRQTKPQVQVRMDKVLGKLGFTALRSNSIFVTSDYTTARGVYASAAGIVYVIFPLDGFTYTWSPNVHDFFVDGIDPYTKGYGYKTYGMPTIPQFMLNTANLGDLKWFKRYYGYKDTDLEQALRTESEVMIRGKYYAVRSDIVTYAGIL